MLSVLDLELCLNAFSQDRKIGSLCVCVYTDTDFFLFRFQSSRERKWESRERWSEADTEVKMGKREREEGDL